MTFVVYSVLILTQYYPPETGAPQNRLANLAKHLNQSGIKVSVLTAMPNYPQMDIHQPYKGKFYVKEKNEDIDVYRSWIFVSKKHTILFRLWNYFSFVFSSTIIGMLKVPKHDIIICESPPLFLGISAMLLKWQKKSKLVFNVSDLWPETAVALGIISNKTILKISTWLEEKIYKQSTLISGQTLSIIKNIKDRFPNKHFFWFRNGIDTSQFSLQSIKTNWRANNSYTDDDFIVLYGGILGYAQNLEVILKAAKLLHSEKKIKFVIVGDGPNKESLIMLANKLMLENVNFLPTVAYTDMLSIVNATNIGVVPLRNIPLFKGAIPSKIFEYLYFKKPILLGVEGEAKQLFIDESNTGLFFTPQNETELVSGIIQLRDNALLMGQLGANGSHLVSTKFNRKTIAAEFKCELDSIMK